MIGLSSRVAAQVAPAALSWPEVRARFQAANPSLQADETVVEELKANEITAFLRPNPQVTATLDQIGHTQATTACRRASFDASNPTISASYLHERQGKRELRRDSAQGATSIAVSGHADLERTLMFTLRSAFVQVLQAKAFLALAQTISPNTTRCLRSAGTGFRPATSRRSISIA